MDRDQYNLSMLRDIVIPDAPSLWPPAAGVWVALGIVVAIVALVGWRLHLIRERNAYRRSGLSLLAQAETAHDISVIVKRVALAAFPREQVASLYGDEWAAFLHRTCPRSYFLALARTMGNTEPDEELVDLADIWIRHHRVPVS